MSPVDCLVKNAVCGKKEGKGGHTAATKLTRWDLSDLDIHNTCVTVV